MKHREARQSRPSKRHLSDLQKIMMQWLYNETRRREKKGEPVLISFPVVVEAMHTEKTSVAIGLRQLLRKGLVTLSLPRGAWTRYVALTELGEEQAYRLVKAARPKPTRSESERSPRQRREKRGRDTGKRSRRMYRR